MLQLYVWNFTVHDVTANPPSVPPSRYLAEGFLHLQKLVGEAIVQWKAMEGGISYQTIDVSVRVGQHALSHRLTNTITMTT